jgi:hypothetical protein
MLLHHFRKAYVETSRAPDASPDSTSAVPVPNFSAVLAELGGSTFNEGLYRVLRPDQVRQHAQLLGQIFPEFSRRAIPFGFDWLGRHFACDMGRIENGQPQVLLMEVGAGEAMEIPADVVTFHNETLLEQADAALALPFWKEWREAHRSLLSFTECVGYRVPLFLGGNDVVANLEVVDLEVYLDICGQLRHGTRKLTDGATINSVQMEGRRISATSNEARGASPAPTKLAPDAGGVGGLFAEIGRRFFSRQGKK